IIEKFTGKKPRGWLGPGLTETWETLDLLAEAGIEYVSDWVNDDQPYEIRTTHGSLVSVPYTLELNDIPTMVIQHHESSAWVQRCSAARAPPWIASAMTAAARKAGAMPARSSSAASTKKNPAKQNSPSRRPRSTPAACAGPSSDCVKLTRIAA